MTEGQGTSNHKKVFMVGAGIMAIATGLQLARRGYQIHYIDRNEPASGASFGNAGSIVSTGAVPEAAPEVFRKALRWMLQKDGFVKMQPRHLPQMVEWLYHYHKAGRLERLQKTTVALSNLVAHSQAVLWPLVKETEVGALVGRTGGLSVYDTKAERDRELAQLAAYNDAYGFSFATEGLSHDELLQLEPDLPRTERFGLLRPDDGTVANPKRLAEHWLSLSLETGGSVIRDQVTGFETADGAVTGIATESSKVIATDGAPVMVASGAWSHRLAVELGHRVPLRASRGYHLQFPDAGKNFRRCVLFEGHGFMMNAMEGGLRFAGTVEYDHPDQPMNDKRVDNLRRRVFTCFPDLEGKGHSTWMGARPSLPDSLPVISGSPNYSNAFFAFGHGALGITNAAATGDLMADLITRQPTKIDVSAYRVDRFKL